MERWVDVPGYEGLYLVSDKGKVMNARTGRILKQETLNKYKRVKLSIGGKQTNHYVHILVATAFISNQNNLPCVNHKDNDQGNNCVENLEWCTYSYNTNYGNANEGRRKHRNDNRKRAVWQYNLAGDLIKVWSSSRSVETDTGFCHTSINRCCNGITNTAYGYVWKYA